MMRQPLVPRDARHNKNEKEVKISGDHGSRQAGTRRARKSTSVFKPPSLDTEQPPLRTLRTSSTSRIGRENRKTHVQSSHVSGATPKVSPETKKKRAEDKEACAGVDGRGRYAECTGNQWATPEHCTLPKGSNQCGTPQTLSLHGGGDVLPRTPLEGGSAGLRVDVRRGRPDSKERRA